MSHLNSQSQAPRGTAEQTKTTLCILIDGFRHDYLEPAQTPFLCELAKKGFSVPLREPFAFQLRPAFFAGLWPEECGIAHLYMLEPEGSPYRFLREAPWLLELEEEWGEMLRPILVAEARRAEICAGHPASGRYAHTARVPFSSLSYFSYSETQLTWMPDGLPSPTIFDHLRARGEKWLWTAYPGDDLRTAAVLEAFRQRFRPEHRLVYLQFGEPDWVGHAKGPHSPQMQACLRQVDNAVRQIVSCLEEAGVVWNGIFFGDHGMVPVARRVNILPLLQQTGLRAPEDYIYFLDSTQARFWFKSDSARRRIEKELARFSGGRVLTEEDLERLHFRFSDKRFGELIWAADEGVVLHPNFFQGKEAVRGMHGYLPEAEANWARLVVAGEGTGLPAAASGEGGPVEMVQIFPILMELLRADIDSPPQYVCEARR